MLRALITGVGGQDGSLLAELLLAEGYDVVGTVSSLARPAANLESLRGEVELLELDLEDQVAVARLIESSRPREIYNLASTSYVPRSWDDPAGVARASVVSVSALLEAVRLTDPTVRVFQASSSEIFGDPADAPQTERTPISPLTPYGAAKAYGHFAVGAFRRRYGLHASSGILFNHESPRRPAEFVTRKVSLAAAAISLGLEQELRLGNLAVRRDWGYAGDYVRAMWTMLQADEPGDYVIATGTARSVEDLVRVAFDDAGLDWRAHVRSDPELVRGSADAPGAGRRQLPFAGGARLAAAGRLRGARPDDGRRRPRAAARPP